MMSALGGIRHILESRAACCGEPWQEASNAYAQAVLPKVALADRVLKGWHRLEAFPVTLHPA
jgi:hypothetical protein